MRYPGLIQQSEKLGHWRKSPFFVPSISNSLKLQGPALLLCRRLGPGIFTVISTTFKQLSRPSARTTVSSVSPLHPGRSATGMTPSGGPSRTPSVAA